MSEAMIEYSLSEDGSAVYARWEWPAGDPRPNGVLCAKNSDSTKSNPLFGRSVYVDVRFKSGVFTGTDVTPRKQLMDYLKSDWIPQELRVGHPEGPGWCSDVFDTLSKRIDAPAPVKADVRYHMSDDQPQWGAVIEGAFSVEPEAIEIELKNPPPRWEGHVPAYLKDPIPQWGDNCRCTVPTPAPDPSRYNATCPCGAPAYRGLDEFHLECSRGCKR